MNISSVCEAARILGTSDETVRRLERAGVLHPVHVTSYGWRFYRKSDVERVARARARALDEKRARVGAGVSR
ncbi:MAG: MerR family transcriptional regulator [Vicinamibacterales bacterium]